MPHYQLYVSDGIHFQQDSGTDEANLGGHPPGGILWKVFPVDFFEAWFVFDIRKIDRYLDNFFQGRPCLFEDSLEARKHPACLQIYILLNDLTCLVVFRCNTAGKDKPTDLPTLGEWIRMVSNFSRRKGRASPWPQGSIF